MLTVPARIGVAQGKVSAGVCVLQMFPRSTGVPFGVPTPVLAAWSRLPSLADKTLFYSTHFTNTSSIAVTRRLGLRRIGASVGVG